MNQKKRTQCHVPGNQREPAQQAREQIPTLSTYLSRIDVSAIAKDRIDIGSAAHIPTIVVDLDADQHLATIKTGQFSCLCHYIPILMPEVQLLLSFKQPACQTRRPNAATSAPLIC